MTNNNDCHIYLNDLKASTPPFRMLRIAINIKNLMLPTQTGCYTNQNKNHLMQAILYDFHFL